jgi:hypothetical protein
MAPFPSHGTPLDQVRWLLEFTSSHMDELYREGNRQLVQVALKNLKTQIELNARLSGELVERHEVTGPGGGPLQVQALVAQLPLLVQQLVPKAEAGDVRAQLLLDRYSRTGEETLDGQLRATRGLLAELEAEARS